MRRLEELRVLVHLLPAPHYETLKFLIQHLRKIADNHEHNMVRKYSSNQITYFANNLEKWAIRLAHGFYFIYDI